MKVKNLMKGLLAAAALVLTVVVTPASIVQAEESQSTYTVERGDNLSKIAGKVYGDPTLWRVIYNANSGAVKDGYIIYKGQVLIIPAVDSNNKPLTVQNTTPEVTTPAPEVPTATVPAPAATTPAPEVPAATVPVPAATTPAPEVPAAPAATIPATTPAPVETQEYTLDYNAIASWVYGGFIGNDVSGNPVVMAVNSENDYAIIIFGDNSDMTAVSFVGPVTYNGDYMTITDEANGLALTFAVVDAGGDALVLDMGDIGAAAVIAATRENVLDTIKSAIENYTHIA